MSKQVTYSGIAAHVQFVPGGDKLTVKCDPKNEEAVEYLRQYKEGEITDRDFFQSFLFDVFAPTKLSILPEALSDGQFGGVVLAFDFAEENGEPIETDDTCYYCFPDQEITDPVETLLTTGKIEYALAE
ncbi:hypothetical protein UFOVP1492_58 [uncultured Caudovirales phage]|uniref:Uncharacterized protein n=1 Tax=uncultured Caudovirales phage TaxID=2100421 RepID=A0A6J5QSC5_9CAUD|nr:hypothetical protein UFOVP1127_76 [uncultured Caudovirales phage]CAB4193712.1 hypothetical protein UFOVP1242_134 [uncultured Caudovirales phage]CAB4217661.1 hypothetical protein UFOVP1492_58 [uncultured Caudovirales phage]CAB5231467.1 hypothetical protein UFOVP1580_87 [uncultured Caudovirales phage]